MNQEIVLVALTSGFFSAIIVKVLDIIQDFVNRKKEEKSRLKKKEEKAKERYLSEKKEVYLEALKKLSLIRLGFDIANDSSNENDKIMKMINEINDNSMELSAKVRLFSSDDIYNLYSDLSKWNRYAFINNGAQQKLTEKSREYYSVYVTILARLMQDDLGYRDYIANPEMIICPKCGDEHDAFKRCKCGMTWQKTMNLIETEIRTAWDNNHKEENI